MNFELEHQVYSVFLAIWASYLLSTNFSFWLGVLVVAYVGLLVVALRRGFYSQLSFANRALRLHSITLIVTIWGVPGLLYFEEHVFGLPVLNIAQAMFIFVIIFAWIIGVEISRHDQEVLEYEWRTM